MLKGVRKEEVQTESLREMGEPDLAATNSASLEASAVSCRQIRVVQQAPIWGSKLRVLPPPCPGSHSPPCFHGNEPVKATRLCLA